VSPLQRLKAVQIPLVLPTVFAGVNQTIMMALAIIFDRAAQEYGRRIQKHRGIKR